MAIEHIQTPREIFESLKEEGYRVDYERIPISPEQAPQDEYLDDFISAVQSRSPMAPILLNCGMGLGRST